MTRQLLHIEVLDRLVRPAFHLLGGWRSAFHLAALLGLMLSTGLVVGLAASRGLSQQVAFALVAFACLTFLGYAALTRIVAGQESMVYYRHVLVIGIAASLLLWCLGRPVLPYLEVLLLGVGLFQAVGRGGCLMVGCCHGRPHTRGVRYNAAHARSGFPDYLVGVRLLPVQLWEMGWGVIAVVAGCWYVVSGQAPGSGLAAYVVLYSTGRFFLEFARGDVGRPHWANLSEAQWTAVGLALLTAAAAWVDLLPGHAWQQAATAGLALLAAVCVLRRRRSRIHRLLHPCHVREIARAIRFRPASDQGAAPSVQETSLGIQLSSGLIEDGGKVEHFAFSAQGGLTHEEADALAQLVFQLRGGAESRKLITRKNGVFHLLIQ